MGRIEAERGNYARATALLEESLKYFKQNQEKMHVAMLLTDLATVAMKQGNREKSKTLLEEGMRLCREHDLKDVIFSNKEISLCLALFAEMARTEGHIERAVRLLGALKTTRGKVTSHRQKGRWTGGDENIASLRIQLGEVDFRRAWQDGLAMSVDEAIEFALADNA
jgi:hypothetical protein